MVWNKSHGHKEKIEPGKWDWECWGWYDTILSGMVNIALMKKVTFEQWLERGEGVRHKDIWVSSVSAMRPKWYYERGRKGQSWVFNPSTIRG